MSFRNVDLIQSGSGDGNEGKVNWNSCNVNHQVTAQQVASPFPQMLPPGRSASTKETAAARTKAADAVAAIRGTLEQLQESLRASREDEALLLRSHAVTRRRVALLSATLRQASHCNQSLSATLMNLPVRVSPSTSETAVQTDEEDGSLQCDVTCRCPCHPRSEGLGARRGSQRTREKTFGGRKPSQCLFTSHHQATSVSASTGVSEGRSCSTERLSRALCDMRGALRARERTVVAVCLKFLRMRRSRQRQARREAQLLHVVHILRTVLQSATSSLIRLTCLLKEKNSSRSPPGKDSPPNQETESSIHHENIFDSVRSPLFPLDQLYPEGKHSSLCRSSNFSMENTVRNTEIHKTPKPSKCHVCSDCVNRCLELYKQFPCNDEFVNTVGVVNETSSTPKCLTRSQNCSRFPLDKTTLESRKSETTASASCNNSSAPEVLKPVPNTIASSRADETVSVFDCRLYDADCSTTENVQSASRRPSNHSLILTEEHNDFPTSRISNVSMSVEPGSMDRSDVSIGSSCSQNNASLSFNNILPTNSSDDITSRNLSFTEYSSSIKSSSFSYSIQRRRLFRRSKRSPKGNIINRSTSSSSSSPKLAFSSKRLPSWPSLSSAPSCVSTSSSQSSIFLRKITSSSTSCDMSSLSSLHTNISMFKSVPYFELGPYDSRLYSGPADEMKSSSTTSLPAEFLAPKENSFNYVNTPHRRSLSAPEEYVEEFSSFDTPLPYKQRGRRRRGRRLVRPRPRLRPRSLSRPEQHFHPRGHPTRQNS